jgi:hypothetical protein
VSFCITEDGTPQVTYYDPASVENELFYAVRTCSVA